VFETLYAKTFLILGSQLALTCATTVLLIALFRRWYREKASWISGKTSDDGELDLDLDWRAVKTKFFILLAADVLVFIALVFFGVENLRIGIPLFALWSVITGLELALCLVAVNENLGWKILSITALITVLAGLIGMHSGINFSTPGKGLFYALTLVISLGLLRIFFTIPRWSQRLGAFFGVLTFMGYLLVDFYRLSEMDKSWSENTWSGAMDLSISMYLDVVNLFLQLLDMLSS
jgi:FtsH-binding integral membrane protein